MLPFRWLITRGWWLMLWLQVLRQATAGSIPVANTIRSLETVVDDWCNVISRYVVAVVVLLTS